MQKVLPRSLSDHNTISLSIDEVNWGPKPFKFFNHWMDEIGFQEMIQTTREKIQTYKATPTNLWAKLRVMRDEIKKWYQMADINDPFKIAKLEEDIERLEKSSQSSTDYEMSKNEVMEKKAALWSLYDKSQG